MNGRGNWTDTIAHTALLLCALVVLVPLFIIVAVLITRGLSAVDFGFLTELPSNGNREGGIYPAIIGTVYLVGITIAAAIPVGVLAAIYLREYAADNKIAALIRLAILNLAGVPSIVHGLFGFALFVLVLDLGSSLLAGALTAAILVLPIVIAASEEALRSVPNGLREASLALGATRWQTTWRTVLPNALPGILTGVILSVGRTAGETAPFMFTVAAFSLPYLPETVFDQAEILSYNLYVIATQVPNMPPERIYGVALVLLALVLGLNFVAIVVRAWFRTRRAR